MIIRITYDKGAINERYSYIYCPDNINVKRKNIKSEFAKWEQSLETWNTDRDKKFFEIHKVGYGYCYDLEDIMVYWINKYTLNYKYGDKARLLDNSRKLQDSYDVDINGDSIPL